MTELIVIRHGETDWNRSMRFQGHVDVPLNALGRLQAQRLGERLAAERVDAFFSSDLLRARETAAPLAQAWAAQPTAQPGLREQAFGVLEGLDAATIQARHPQLWQQWLAYREDAAPPGGESLREFSARVLDAIGQLAAQAAGGRIAVVTHGGVLDMLWRHAHGLTLSARRGCEIPNTGINRLRMQSGQIEILSWADADHLRGLPEPVDPG